jgi:hypothetical protein
MAIKIKASCQQPFGAMAGLGHFNKVCFLIKVLFIFAKFSPDNPPLHQAANRCPQL